MSKYTLGVDLTPDQIVAAREYIRRVRDPRLISDRIAEIATLPLEEIQREWDAMPINDEKIHAARLLISLHGGEENVDAGTVAMAKMPMSSEVEHAQ